MGAGGSSRVRKETVHLKRNPVAVTKWEFLAVELNTIECWR